MKTLSQTSLGLAVLAIALSLGAARAQAQRPTDAHPRAPGKLPTQPFRDEHAQVRQHLKEMAARVGQLRNESADAQKKSMGEVVAFFQQHIKPHAEWEERHLYPVVDKLAGCPTARPFTSTMRFEHRVIGGWIDELAREAKKPAPDAVAFSRRADNLFGLLSAHFDEEEQVLLPLIDAKMTPAQFEKAVGGAGAH